MDNILTLKTINELREYAFFIPSYQRGYRWTDKEVEDLLNDINEFGPKDISDESNEKTWYCLQPIVVKQNENNYEVIDGQQRLTTIYLILQYLNQDFREDKREKLFHLSYETRIETEKFLNALDDSGDINNRNIDFYYISKAYGTICNWFESREMNFDKNDFRSKLKFHSKVIWYESVEDDSIAIFTRINIGKIPLTNSELIKALFLNSSNFDKNSEEKLRLKQLEIATEWDDIEHALQNDKLWYFISGSVGYTNRIELIFNLINDDEDRNDIYSTFRYFNKILSKKNRETVEKCWAEVKKYYQTFIDWYDDRELYHKIGYLIYVDCVNIKDLYCQSIQSTKSDFKKYLDDLIKDNLKNVDLDKLEYVNNGNKGNKDVEKVLLLYNILTMLKTCKDNSYFPFHLYKTGEWDIEHITSIKDSMPDKRRKDWLNDAIPFIDDSISEGKKLKRRAQEVDCENDEVFKTLFEDIVSHFNKYIDDDDINDITNLTLLDSNTNRGYKNVVFPLKRKIIIDKDKSGTFIPICTKNVFLKYFSDYPPKISFWSTDDREKYEKDLYKVVGEYLGKGEK